MPAAKRQPPAIQHMNDDDRSFLIEVEKKRAELRLSKNQFAKLALKISNGTYSKLLRDCYPGNTAAKMKAVREEFARMRNVTALTAVAATVASSGEIFETRTLRAVKKAMLEVSVRTDENRMVVFLAPTGGGKDTVIRHLRGTIADFNTGEALFDFVDVEARESWRKSYFAAMCDILAAVDGTDAHNFSTNEVENMLVGAMRKRRCLLAINEANYFGPQAFNLLKFIINQTPTIILICAIPSIYAKMKLKSWAEAGQVNRRAYVTISAPDISAEEVALFMAGVDFADPEDLLPASEMVAAAANAFAEVLEDAEGVSLANVERAIAKVQAFFDPAVTAKRAG